MTITDTEIAAFIQQYILPLFRIASLFMVMPIIGSRTVTSRVRIALAILVTILVVPMLPPLSVVKSLSLATFLIVVQEVVIGVLIGFVFQIVFQVFVLSGQFMAMKMGLGFASMNDPTNGVQTTVLSQFFLMLMTLVFVSLDGHILLISLVVESFVTLPPGAWVITPGMFMQVVEMSTWLFSAALVFSLPVLTSLLFVNIAFGVMSRAAPQLNIFAVGFPFTLVMGLVLIWVGLNNFLPAFEEVMSFGFITTESLLRLR